MKKKPSALPKKPKSVPAEAVFELAAWLEALS
jgi:hypothetical protein